ncbi:MAG: histidine phosphatase family protein [Anaerolineae bacterium]
MQLYLIRHGQSANNAIDVADEPAFRLLRHHDPELTDLGHEQAARLAEYLAGGNAHDRQFAITHLYTSPMRRALATTRPIAEALGLTPQVWVDIHEAGGMFLDQEDGTVVGYPGIGRAEVAALYPGWVLPPELTDEGWWAPERGEETRPESFERARRVAGELLALWRAEPEASVALVSHGAFLDRLIRMLIGHAPTSMEDYHLAYVHHNTGLSRINLTERWGIHIHWLNRVEHLPEGMLSW